MRTALWSLTALVFTTALAVWLLPWVIAIVAGGFAIWVTWLFIELEVAAWDQRRDRHKALAARADWQHRQIIRGNPQGIYGDLETVKHMREILQWPDPPTTRRPAMDQATHLSNQRRFVAERARPTAKRQMHATAATVQDAAPTGSSTPSTGPTA